MSVQIGTGQVQVVVSTQPFGFEVSYPGTQLATSPDALGRGMVNAVIQDVGDCHTQLSVADLQVDIAVTDRELSVCVRGPAPRLALQSHAQEHYLGLGERFDRIDQRGRVIDLWVTNAASGQDSYKPVSWIMSSHGWGCWSDQSEKQSWALAHLQAPNSAVLSVSGERLAVSFCFGDYRQLLAQYPKQRPAALPPWAMHPWISGDWRSDDQQSVLQSCQQAMQHAIPTGVRLIDAMWEPAEHTLSFDPQKYPDPKAMIDRLAQLGIRVVLWISPNMTADTPAYARAAQEGWLITKDGAPYLHQLGNQPGWQGTALDFTNPATVHWWRNGLARLLDMGIAGFKTDFGEQVPADAQFHDGTNGATRHNDYPYLYNRVTWEAIEGRDGLTMARSAWAGSQGLSAVWAGDQSSDANPATGLASAIVAAQTAGLSGFAYWASDIGGYFGVPVPELYARWAQFGAVCPIMQVHGLGERYPWQFGTQIEDIYRDWAQFHERLIPYLSALAQEHSQTGMPPIRAMALQFPQDPQVYEHWVDYQFCLGPDLIIAPLYFQGTRRHVLLPGVWRDLVTGREVSGRVEIDVTLPDLPMFLRAGGQLLLCREQTVDIIANPVADGASHWRLPNGVRSVLRGYEVDIELPDGWTATLNGRQIDAGRSILGKEDYVGFGR